MLWGVASHRADDGIHGGGEAQRAASARLDFSRRVIDLFLTARSGNHVSAGIGEAKRKGAANAGCAAGNDRDFVFKVEQIGGH